MLRRARSATEASSETESTRSRPEDTPSNGDREKTSGAFVSIRSYGREEKEGEDGEDAVEQCEVSIQHHGHES